MYDRIFFTNVLRLLKEKGMNKTDLHTASGVSASIISDITRGQGNPTLETMSAIATALDTPLPDLLLTIDPEVMQQLPTIEKPNINSDLPKGFERVIAILPAHKAFIVNKWGDETQKALSKSKNPK